MAIVPLNYTPPSYTTTNVLYGVGILFTAPTGTAVPADAFLGYGTSWTGLGWSYIGGTLDGVTLTFAPTTTPIVSRSARRARRSSSASAMPITVCATIPEPTTKISVSHVDCQNVGSWISRVKLASPVNW